MTNEASKPANPYATGGGGSDFENQVAAVYLASVLLRMTPRGFDAGQADEVRLQRGFQGEPLDDLIVFVVLPDARAKLSLQIKRDVTYGARNETFNKIVSACWATFKAPSFNQAHDRFGIACGLCAKVVDEHYQAVLRYAQTSASAADFLTRVTAPGQSNHQRNFLGLVRGRLDVAAGGPISDDELWHFLRAMVILRFDVQQEGSSGDRTNTVANLVSLLPVEDSTQALRILDRLVQIAAQGNRTAGSFDREALQSMLRSAGFRLSSEQGPIRTPTTGIAAQKDYVDRTGCAAPHPGGAANFAPAGPDSLGDARAIFHVIGEAPRAAHGGPDTPLRF